MYNLFMLIYLILITFLSFIIVDFINVLNNKKISLSLFILSLIGGVTGWVIFAIIWACAVIGVLLNAIDLEKFIIPSVLMYLVMGWMIIFSYDSVATLLPTPGLALLIAGGISYTVGAILYAIGSKKKYFHS